MSEHASIGSPVNTVPASIKTGALAVSTQSQNLDTESFQPIFVQKKLTVGAVDDPLEDEADAMADKVMRMPEQNFIQRKCAHCEEEEKAQRKPLASFIQKKEAGGNNTVSATISNQIESTKGSGNPISETTKSFMESRFGTDFSNVKIHTGNYASQLSKELKAQAFTVSNDIYFNEGKYQPESNEGKHLLAHELTHTIQQKPSKASAKSMVQRSPGDKEPEKDTGTPYDEESVVIRYAIGALELGKLKPAVVLYNSKTWKAEALSESTFSVGPFFSDMGNFYYVYRFTEPLAADGGYTISRGTFLLGSDTKDLRADLSKVQGKTILKVKTTGLIPPVGGGSSKPTKGEAKPGIDKGGKGEDNPELEELTLSPERKTWLNAGREGMKREINAQFNEIQKLKAARINTWEKNANIKDPKPLRAALEVAVEVVGYGLGGVVGGLLTEELAHGLAKEFAKEALLKSTAKLSEFIFEHAVEPAGEFMEEATKKALKESKGGNASGALATKSSLLDCFVEAMTLQSVSEEHVQTREFNSIPDSKFTDIQLADLVLVYEKLYAILNSQPHAFLRELSQGLLRLKDELYLEEHPKDHESGERSGSLLVIPHPPSSSIGKWYRPNLNFDHFYALATEINNATLAEISGTAVKDLPFTLGFRFWVDNPFQGTWGRQIFMDVLSKVWFQRRSDGVIWVDFNDADDENGYEWLASYYLNASRELSKEERHTNAPNGALKLYNQIKNKPVKDLSNFDIL